MTLSQGRAKLIARLHRRRTRAREGLVLAEGVRVVAEILDTPAEITFAVVSPRGHELGAGPLVDALAGRGIETFEVDERAFAELAGTETPQGVLAVCREPSVDAGELANGRARLLVLDGVQDPGNAGTLVRTAAAFGLTGVIALDGTVDPWNPRTVRAAAGTLFRLPVARLSWAEARALLAGAGVRLLVADAAGHSVGPRRPDRPWALVVGSEGEGARPEVLEAAASRIAVPMPGGTESLNAGVAGSILMYALTRDDDAS